MPEVAGSALLAVPGVRLDTCAPSLPGECHMRFESSEHIIEIEVAGSSQSTISVRFAVCQTASIDDVFADLVAHLARVLDASVHIAEEVEPSAQDVGTLSPSAGVEFRRALKTSIEMKRRLWRAEFGNQVARVTCREAVDRFVIGQ